MILPWQTTQWQQLSKAKQENRLPHALLFSGIAGVGKQHFAENFIRKYVCALQSDEANCDCHACRLIANRTHPNLMWVEPEKIGSAIKVDQIREVSEFINQTSLQHDYRIVLINPADAMNASASNALLKTLEEPTPGSYIFLIAGQTSKLPATILSRCQRVSFPRPATELALAWLKNQVKDSTFDVELMLRLANGAPLTALEFINNKTLAERANLFQTLYSLSCMQVDPIKSAVKIQGLDTLQFLDFMFAWTMDMARLQLGSATHNIINQDFLNQLLELKEKNTDYETLKYLDFLQKTLAEIKTGINFNKQLLIENVLIRWMECVKCF